MKARFPKWHAHQVAFAAILLCIGGEVSALTSLPTGDADYYASSQYIFLPDELAFVDISMSQGALDSLLEDPWSDEYRRCSLRFRNSRIDEVVENVGIRVRGNTSRTAIKKSWKLSFNTFVPDRKFHGLEKMNLNGEHNDVSIIRSSLAMDLYRRLFVPSSRTHHAIVKINDGAQVEGVQIHVEQIDEEFAQAWFSNKDSSLYKCLYQGDRADLKWVSPGDGNAYAQLGYGRTYEEKNLIDPNYEDLADFIEFVNLSGDSEFAEGLGERFGIDNFLRAMAADIALGHWDNYWYGANNYYLYHNSDSGRFEYIPYDLDNCCGVDFFGINWATRPWSGWGDGGYGSEGGQLPPLIRRVLSHEPFRLRIQSYLRELVEGPFTLAAQEENIDMIHAMIGPYAFEGSYDDGHMDWGYTTEMFHESYDEPDYYRDWGWGWDYGLKPYLQDRSDYLYGTVPPSPSPPSLRINEFQSANDTTYSDEWGDFDDWVEIYNAGEEAFQMGGLYLSDSFGNPTRFEFPDTLLQAGGFLLVWCDSEAAEGPWHAGFSISSAGEQLGLFHRASEGLAPLDTLNFGPLLDDWSLARLPDGSGDWQYVDHPTPAYSNVPVDVPPQEGGRLGGMRVWPNPLSGRSEIAFQLAGSGRAKLRVLSSLGREIYAYEENFDSGENRFMWDGRDSRGRPVPAGLYLLRIEAGPEIASRKILVLR